MAAKCLIEGCLRHSEWTPALSCGPSSAVAEHRANAPHDLVYKIRHISFLATVIVGHEQSAASLFMDDPAGEVNCVDTGEPSILPSGQPTNGSGKSMVLYPNPGPNIYLKPGRRPEEVFGSQAQAD